jgi:hypothetical protein
MSECVRGLTSTDIGPHQWSVTAIQNGETVSGSIVVQIGNPPPPPPPPPALPNGAYTISLSGNSIDGSFGFNNQTPFVRLAPTNSSTAQQWVWNGSQLSNVLVAGSGASSVAGTWTQTGSGTDTVAGVMAFKASGPVSLTQHVLGLDGTLTVSSSFSQAFSQAVSSGGFVVGAVTQHAAGAAGFLVTSITDDKNNAYTLVDSAAPNNLAGAELLTFYGGPFTNGPTTLTFTGSGGSGVGQRWRVQLAEFAGLSGTIDGHAMQAQAAPGNGTNAITSGSISPTVNGDLIYGAMLLYGTNPATLAPGAGFTLLDDGSPSTDSVVMGQEYLARNAGSYMADYGDGTVTENTSADAWTISSSGNGYTVLNNRTGRYLSSVSNVLGMSSTQTPWTISNPPSPTPTAITLSPASTTIADNAPAGTLLATATVTMSDGSQFTATLTTSNTNIFAISGMQIVTARALTSADDGTQSTIITASQGSQALSMEFSL